ncbi:hypothetical protein MN116_005504 [Schistosoma mekongi]|uniref:Uncharacterized protein n=1 Tax=Schistosoma mekongi TaxID=38744 RepID=A0AAE1ZC57_SCHME|nr:hypothetical protein MN116_005504 [Schistosoma mekongi]
MKAVSNNINYVLYLSLIQSIALDFLPVQMIQLFFTSIYKMHASQYVSISPFHSVEKEEGTLTNIMFPFE